MNEDQREALQASIEHWRENVERHAKGEEMEIGSEYCACCEYSAGESKSSAIAFCDACPIAQYTGEDDCYKTPYYAVIRGKASPTEMLDWLVALEDGSEPPFLFNEPYAF
jgi:hypothetical protein